MCVVEPPTIVYDPVSISVNNGSYVTFDCISLSHANVAYMWLKDTEELQDDDVNIIISTGSIESINIYATTLTILDVQLSDNGVYVCSATNRKGTTLSNGATLSVIGNGKL